MTSTIIIATRESPLAIRQAETVRALLRTHHPELNVEFLGITTKADTFLDISLIEMGGKGVFVKELEEALLDGRADIAVHSMKDVPMVLPEGLCLPVICARENPRDVFVSNQYASLAALPQGAVLGTSSLRRQTQLRVLRPDLCLKDLRGNINTRLHKLDRGEFDGLILAAAGLIRMNLDQRIRCYLSLEESLPAAGQGALGLECREGDTAILKLIAPLNHAFTALCVRAERAMCTQLGGGCQVPVAAYAQIEKEHLQLRGLVASKDSQIMLRAQVVGTLEAPEKLGNEAARILLQQGAAEILQAFQ